VQVSELFPGFGHLEKSVQVLGLSHLPRQLVAFVSIFSVVGHVPRTNAVASPGMGITERLNLLRSCAADRAALAV
jgi:hypothetical protein